MRSEGDTRPGRWAGDLAQEHLPDEVVHAGLCKPNAPGRTAYSSLAAFEHRQILKSLGLYRGERVIVAATTVEICALSLSVRGRVCDIHHWNRWTTPVVLTPRRGAAPAGAPAFTIGHVRRYDAIQVVPVDPYAAEGLLALINQRAPEGTRPVR